MKRHETSFMISRRDTSMTNFDLMTYKSKSICTNKNSLHKTMGSLTTVGCLLFFTIICTTYFGKKKSSAKRESNDVPQEWIFLSHNVFRDWFRQIKLHIHNLSKRSSSTALAEIHDDDFFFYDDENDTIQGIIESSPTSQQGKDAPVSVLDDTSNACKSMNFPIHFFVVYDGDVTISMLETMHNIRKWAYPFEISLVPIIRKRQCPLCFGNVQDNYHLQNYQSPRVSDNRSCLCEMMTIICCLYHLDEISENTEPTNGIFLYQPQLGDITTKNDWQSFFTILMNKYNHRVRYDYYDCCAPIIPKPMIVPHSHIHSFLYNVVVTSDHFTHVRIDTISDDSSTDDSM